MGFPKTYNEKQYRYTLYAFCIVLGLYILILGFYIVDRHDFSRLPLMFSILPPVFFIYKVTIDAGQLKIKNYFQKAGNKGVIIEIKDIKSITLRYNKNNKLKNIKIEYINRVGYDTFHSINRNLVRELDQLVDDLKALNKNIAIFEC